MGGRGRCQRAVISDLMDLYLCVQPHESDWVTTKVSECRSMLAETITSAPEDRQAERQTDNQEACIHRRGQRISVGSWREDHKLHWPLGVVCLLSPFSFVSPTANRELGCVVLWWRMQVQQWELRSIFPAGRGLDTEVITQTIHRVKHRDNEHRKHTTTDTRIQSQSSKQPHKHTYSMVQSLNKQAK